jgi:hypothetical protein
MDIKEKIATLEDEIKYQKISNELLMLKKKKVLEEELIDDFDSYDIIYAFTDYNRDLVGYRLLSKKDQEIYAIMQLVDINSKNHKGIIADYGNNEYIERLIELSKLKDDVSRKPGIEEMLVGFGIAIIFLSVIASVLGMFSNVIAGFGILLGGVPIGLILLALSKMLVLLKEISDKTK